MAKDLNDISVIENSLVIWQPNISVSSANTTVPSLNQANAVLVQNLGQSPLLLKSLYLSYDSTFGSKYSVYVEMEGLNIANNTFNLPPAASGGFDFVPTGTSYKIPAQATLKIYAYNSGGAATNGTLNVLGIFDVLDAQKG